MGEREGGSGKRERSLEDSPSFPLLLLPLLPVLYGIHVQ